MKRFEATFVVVLLGVVGLGLLLDAVLPTRAVEGTGTDSGPFVSSGWYCPVPPGDGFQMVMSTGNLGDAPLGLRRSVIGGSGQSAVEQTGIEPRSTGNKAMAEFGMANSAGLVEAFGGNNSTNLVVLSRAEGAAWSRCSDQPSARWLFATGSTVRGSDHYLQIANPFREEAVVSVRLMTPDSEEVPARLKDVVVRTLTQTSLYLSDYLLEEPTFGIEVTASRGRVIVARYSRLSAGAGQGISHTVGARRPSTRWVFAAGRVPEDGEESLVIVNPSEREALVGMVFMTATERSAPPALSEVPVPAGRQVEVKLSDHLPRGTAYGVELVSINDVRIVAERQTAGIVNGNRSYESVFGVTGSAARWAIPVGAPAEGSSTLAMVNTGQAPITVGITLLGEDGPASPAELSSLVVEPGLRVDVDLAPFLGGGVATAVVEADQPVLAVESQSFVGGLYGDLAATAGHTP